jgi:hypothetical protein
MEKYLQINELSEEDKKKFEELLGKLGEMGVESLLPPEELQAYRDAQMSVIHARNSAPQNEGNIVII